MSAGVHSYDVVVVGAGLFGAAVARECALRGLSVALVERDEVASGASRVGQVLLGDGLSTGGDAGTLAGLAALAPHLVSIVPVEGAGLGSVVDVTRLTQLYAIDAVARGSALFVGVPVAGVEGGDVGASATRKVVLADDRTLEARAVVLATGAWTPPMTDAVAPRTRRLRVVDAFAAPPKPGRVVGAASDVLVFPTKTGVRLFVPDGAKEAVHSALEAAGLEGAPLVASDLLEVAIADETPGDGAPGLARISESGPGAHRAVATYLADVFARAAGRDLASLPRDAMLPGGEVLVRALPLAERWGVSELAVRGMVSRHGSRVVEVLGRTLHAPEERAVVCACETVLECEVRYVCRVEGARSLRDVARRTNVGAGMCNGLECAHRAAQVVRQEAGSTAGDSNDAAWAFLSARFDGRAPFFRSADLAREEVVLSRLMSAGVGRASGSSGEGEQ